MEDVRKTLPKLPNGEPMPKLKDVFMSGDIMSSRVVREFNRKHAKPNSRMLELSKTDPEMMEHFEVKHQFEKQLEDTTFQLATQPELLKVAQNHRLKLDTDYTTSITNLKNEPKEVELIHKKAATSEYDKDIEEWVQNFTKLEAQTEILSEESIQIANLISGYEEAIQLRLKRDDTYFELVEEAHDFYVEKFDEFFSMVYDHVEQAVIYAWDLDDMLAIVYHFFEECRNSTQK